MQGQVEALARLLRDQRECNDVLQQIAAVRGAATSLMADVLEEHLQEHLSNQSGSGNAYVVSAGSDLRVKLNVNSVGKLGFTVDADTTRYIDLNDPTNAATSGVKAGMNPQGIVINDQAIGSIAAGTRAYTMNYVSRNVSCSGVPYRKQRTEPEICSAGSGSLIRRRLIRQTSRADNSNALRSLVRWLSTRRSCCSTSRPPRLIPK